MTLHFLNDVANDTESILVIVSFTSLSWGDPFKSHEIAPYLRLPLEFFTQINIMWINIFVFQIPDILGLR